MRKIVTTTVRVLHRWAAPVGCTLMSLAIGLRYLNQEPLPFAYVLGVFAMAGLIWVMAIEDRL